MVPWSSSMARPDGVWRRVGRGLVGAVEEASFDGGYSFAVDDDMIGYAMYRN